MIATFDWTAVATIVLVVVTGVYVALTYKLVQAQTDPCVVVYARHDESRPGCLEIVIQNIGKGLARDVEFELSAPIPNWAGSKTHLTTSGPLIKGIPALGPGDHRKMFWGRYSDVSNTLGNGTVYVTCRFKNARFRDMIPVECVLEVRSFEGCDAVDSDGARQCARELKRIADDVRKAIH